LIQRGKPWGKHASDLIEAFDYYSFATQFGWTDEEVDKMKDERPEKYQMYRSILKGTSMAEKRK